MADIQHFGRTAAGQEVQAITLRAGVASARILTLGAALQSLRLAGVAHDLTLGSDDPADYEGALCHLGTLIAPVANRIAHGRAPLPGGGMLETPRNQEGRHSLHSGPAGTHLKLWQIDEAGDDHVTLSLDLPDGEGGFPGNRRITARFSLHPPATLRLEVRGETDRPTLWNPANHSYWNLDGTASFAGHRLRIAADRVLPTDADALVTGEILPVTGTWADFRRERALAPDDPPLDHCFCLAEGPRALAPVLWLRGQSGIAMEVATTEPGIQVYDARSFARRGRQRYEGLAIEAQHWPDAPNHPGFPPITLLPGQPRLQITEWKFSQDD